MAVDHRLIYSASWISPTSAAGMGRSHTPASGPRRSLDGSATTSQPSAATEPRDDLRPVGGGGKTTAVTGMPSAQGLFDGAIAQSGSAFRGRSASDATDGAERFLAKLDLERNQIEKLHPARLEALETPITPSRASSGSRTGP